MFSLRLAPVLTALVAIVLAATAHAAIPQKERDALIAVYDATGGAQWQFSDHWKEAPGTECTWYAVACNEAETTVIGLFLAGNNLNGTLPAAMADLSNLADLQLQNGNLSGSIPGDIGNLSALEILDLSSNRFSGSIPSSLGSLVNLKELRLANNQLTGTIPKELGNLRALRFLDLSINRLSGTIPRELGSAVQLLELVLGNNNLTGDIPSEIGSLSSLATLQLNQNLLTGQIPQTFGQLTNLELLDLSDNRLNGPIPGGIGNLSSLTQFFAVSNELSGEIPAALYGLTALQDLDLTDNNLTGPISGDIAGLQALSTVGLGSNSLSGPIPAQITSLTKLTVLHLADNQLTGTIPADMDRLATLVELELGPNNLSGTIPVSIARLPNLKILALRGAHLTGTIPPELGSLSSLEILNLEDNALTGPIPSTLRSLSNLEQLYLGLNQLTGAVPDWFPELTKITTIYLNVDLLSGPIPDSITSATSLQILDVGSNNLSGSIPVTIGNLSKLAYLTLDDNDLTGPIPESLWDLAGMADLRLGQNHLSGPLSPRVSGLTKLEVLYLRGNGLSGAIPPEIGQLQSLVYLSLGGNRFSGGIPPQLANLAALQFVDLSDNNLSGAFPSQLRNMSSLANDGSNFSYNALFSSDASLLAFLDQKQPGGGVLRTQTLTPTNLRVTQTTDRSAFVEWDLISYLDDQGGYQVRASLNPNGAAVVVATASSKYVNSVVVRNLEASTSYFFTVTAVTYPHDVQQNLVASDPSPAVSASTGPHTDAPADVVVTTQASGIVEIDGVPQNEDSFTLTNFGDAETTITLERGGDFFTIAPETFTLAGGASQTVVVTALPKPEDFYFGDVLALGDGTGDGVVVDIVLLSVVRPSGGAIAEPLTSRVEVTGLPGSNSVGTVSFKNRGTVPLRGILLSDVPWIIPPRDTIGIDPNDTRAITFTVDRSRRPSDNGALTGTLTFIYIGGTLGTSDASSAEARGPSAQAGTPGPSTSRVVVVDVAKPQVAPGTIPPLAPGEVAFSIPGITALTRGQSSLVSDLDILNAFGSRPVGDLRLYFANASISSVATLASVAANQSLSFANIVSTVYGSPAPTGALQVRSRDWQDLIVGGRLLRLGDVTGTVAGDLPVFRSDRVIRAGQTLRLTGIRQGGSLSTTIYIQELTGVAARAHADFLDATGKKLGERDVEVIGFAFTELADVVPTGTVTAVLRNSGTSGGLVAYARVSDQSSGDSWSIIDWRSFYDFSVGAQMLVPVVETAAVSQSPGRRRAISHASATQSSATELSLFNASSTETARVVLQFNGSQKQIVISPRTTTTLDVASTFGASGSGSGSLSITADKGDVAITSRIARPSPSGGTYGTAVPIVTAQSGLRIGQSHVFANIEDPSAATIAAAAPGTFRTSYGFAETSGAPVTVRATVSLPDGRTLIRVNRDIVLSANQYATFDGVVKSIIGNTRDTRYGDLHNLQLRLEVIDGSGSVVPFVMSTENATGDSVLRLE